MPLSIETTAGVFVAHYSQKGLAGMDFPTAANPLQETQPPSAQLRRWHARTTRALRDILAGREPNAMPPLDLSGGSEFQQRVWSALRRLGPGETRSYSEIADAIGNPGAARAVGAACGANPIPVLVPCHRVLAANHRLGGFSGGLEWKRILLEREGIRLVSEQKESGERQMELVPNRNSDRAANQPATFRTALTRSSNGPPLRR